MRFIPVAQPDLGNSEKKYVLECLESTWVSSRGVFIEKFEQQFARAIKTKYAATASNGTAALHLALLALGIGPDDEVILPAFTFVATANAIVYTGAKPVFVDIDQHTWNIDSTKIEKEITKKTRAIIAVHLYGYPAAMGNIMAIARKHKLFVVEDAAEALGATIKDRPVGSIGHIGAFSFYGNKIVTTGEGGMVTTNNKQLFEKVNFLKSHGMSTKKRYYHPAIGYNYRMTNLQAAIGLAQLQKLPQALRRRMEIEKTYKNYLKEVPGLVFQPRRREIHSVCWMFSFRLTKAYGKSRAALMQYLKKHSIDSRPFFYPLTDLPMYKNKKKFPVAKQIASKGVSIPTFVNLTQKQIVHIVNTIHEFKK